MGLGECAACPKPPPLSPCHNTSGRDAPTLTYPLVRTRACVSSTHLAPILGSCAQSCKPCGVAVGPSPCFVKTPPSPPPFLFTVKLVLVQTGVTNPRFPPLILIFTVLHSLNLHSQISTVRSTQSDLHSQVFSVPPLPSVRCQAPPKPVCLPSLCHCGQVLLLLRQRAQGAERSEPPPPHTHTLTPTYRVHSVHTHSIHTQALRHLAQRRLTNHW